MNLILQEKETSFLYETPLVHQSSFWSQVKHNQGYQTKAFDIQVRSSDISSLGGSSYLLDDVLVLLSPINRTQTIGYVPYGPALKPLEDKMGPFLEDLSLQLQEKLPDNCILLRYDLPWQRIWDEEEISLQSQQVRLNWGTSLHQIRKSCSDQLPSDTMFVDLRGSEDDLLARMHRKTRYNIGLARRKGVEVREVSHESLPIFYALYTETCQRNNIQLHDLRFFESLFVTEPEKSHFSLLVAYLDGVPLSSMFLTRSEGRATYLYGASSSSRRNSMSTYALQWSAIQKARSWGCTSYDLFGVSPTEDRDHPLSSLTTFKKGFGGEFIHRMGCWDFLFDQDHGEEFYAFELTARSYHCR